MTRLRELLVVALAATSLLGACAPNGEEGAAGAGEQPEAHAEGVRFVLEVAPAAHEPVFVQLAGESDPVAWLEVRTGTERVALEPMCDVPDCGEDPVVCGAALPRVRRIAERDGAGSVAYQWDGTTSVVEEQGQCERRVAAPGGEYTARLCWSHEAEMDDSVDPASETGTMGRVVGRTCTERTFILGTDREVVVRLP